MKRHVNICLTESLCCTVDINIVNQLKFKNMTLFHILKKISNLMSIMIKNKMNIP